MGGVCELMASQALQQATVCQASISQNKVLARVTPIIECDAIVRCHSVCNDPCVVLHVGAQVSEFDSIYKLPVAVVPTNRSVSRTDNPDVVFRLEEYKWKVGGVTGVTGLMDGRMVG